MLRDFLISFISVGSSLYSYSIIEKKWPEYNRKNKPLLGHTSVALAAPRRTRTGKPVYLGIY